MFDYAHQRARQVMGTFHKVTLATSGPAGVQAGVFACEACDLQLYLLIPKTSDHLFNLEHHSQVTLLSGEWELNGAARLVTTPESPIGLALLDQPDAQWCTLVCVRPQRMQVHHKHGWGSLETIDLAAEP